MLEKGVGEVGGFATLDRVGWDDGIRDRGKLKFKNSNKPETRNNNHI